MTSPVVVPTDIVRRAVEVVRTHFATLYPVALIFSLIQAMATVALEDTNVAGLALAVSLVLSTMFLGMVVGFVRDVEAGLPPGSEPAPGALLAAAAPVLDKLLLVSIVSALGILLGLIALVVPGLWLLTVWAVVAPVVVLERTGVRGALARSRELVAGHGWPVLGTVLLLTLLLLPVALVTAVATEAFGTVLGSFVQVLAGALASTVAVVGTSTLYFRLRDAEAVGSSGDDATAEDPGDGPDGPWGRGGPGGSGGTGGQGGAGGPDRPGGEDEAVKDLWRA